MDSITPEQALALFELPRTLGATAEGEPIIANVGRFGPYIKYGAKYVSLKDDPYTVTLERALECIRIKQEADANRIIQDFTAEGIQVLNGRYGPYVSNREKNARAPKDRDPKSLTLEECRALLEAAPNRAARGRGRFGARKASATAPAATDAGTPKTGTVKTARRSRNKPRVAPAPGATVTALAAKSAAPLKVTRIDGAAPKKKAKRKARPGARKAAAKAGSKTVANRPTIKKAAGAV
jgi:DNA topoisomerase-1